MKRPATISSASDDASANVRPRWLSLTFITLRWAVRLAWLAPFVALMWKSRPYYVDLLAQFAPQAGLIVILSAAPFFLIRKLRRLGLEGLVAGITIILLSLGATMPWQGNALVRSSRSYTLVVFNAQVRRDIGAGSFEEWLLNQDPDLICIIEPPMGMASGVEWIHERYPHQLGPRRGLKWALLLLSKFPMTPLPLAEYSPETRLSFVARRSVRVDAPDGARFLFTAMHPPSPRSAELWREAIAEVQRDGDILRRSREHHSLPIIVAGDFNTTPTGRVCLTLMRTSNLRTAARSYFRGTWPAWAPPAVSLPIDGALISPDVQIHSVTVGPTFRSDHRPVVIKFSVEMRSSIAEPEAAIDVIDQ